MSDSPSTTVDPADPGAWLEVRRELAYFMRRLYRLGLTTTSGGNISRRLTPDLIAVTPAAMDKARIRADQIALVTRDGQQVSTGIKPTSELRMHLRLYEARADVQAIVHAHPVTASAFTAARTPINVRLLAETYALVGDPVVAPYALTGTEALAQLVADAGRGANCILLENHGITCLGDTLLRAFDRLELIEAAARMTLVTRQLEGAHDLTPVQCRELDHLMGRY